MRLLLTLLFSCFNDATSAERSGPASGAPTEVQAATTGIAPAALAARFQLGAAAIHGSLKIWPVLDTLPARAEAEGALALSEALAGQKATVAEVDAGGSVPTLTITNTGARPVLASAGDVVIGGKQDRILTETILIAPGSTESVAVNCVEQGRWHAAEGSNFAYGGKGELDLRRTVRTEKDQGQTWAKVAEVNAEKARHIPEAADELAPETGTYRASLSTGAVAEKVEPYVEALSPVLAKDPRTVGYVAAIGGRMQSIELYGSPMLFASTREQAIRSLGLEALGSQEKGVPPDDAAARAVLDRSFSGAVSTRAKKGAAEEVEMKEEGQRSYLVYGEDGELLQALGYVE